MYSRFGLDRFKKAQTTDGFQVNENRTTPSAVANDTRPAHGPFETAPVVAQASLASTAPVVSPNVFMPPATDATRGTPEASISTGKPSPLPGFNSPSGHIMRAATLGSPAQSGQPQNSHATTVGGGASTWQPPDWAVEPRSGIYQLEVSKDGQVVDTIVLDKKRTLFGRQHATCDYVLDHPSLSRQHAAVIHHKNGSVFVVDLGSIHGTFVSNERLLKDIPVEIEPGQSLRFAASSRIYILRKSSVPPVLPTPTPIPPGIHLPPPPDPDNAEAVLQYNTLLNRFGMPSTGMKGGPTKEHEESKKRKREVADALAAVMGGKRRVSFRDQNGGILVDIVGFSDGVDVSSEPGPMGAKEGGSLVGKFDSLVQTVLIPRGKAKGTGEGNEQAATAFVGGKGEASQSQSKAAQSGKLAERSGGMSTQLRQYMGQSLTKMTEKGLYGGLGDVSVSVSRQSWGNMARPDAERRDSEGVSLGDVHGRASDHKHEDGDIFGQS